MRGKLKLLQEESESVQVTPADMPNAQRQFNGLHNSIQQMAREMPSLAMGPQMFFLAISNNLPILRTNWPVPVRNMMSCRSQARKAHRYGNRSCPRSFLAEAMTTGIMLLVMYGDEIWDWTKTCSVPKRRG